MAIYLLKRYIKLINLGCYRVTGVFLGWRDSSALEQRFQHIYEGVGGGGR